MFDLWSNLTDAYFQNSYGQSEYEPQQGGGYASQDGGQGVDYSDYDEVEIITAPSAGKDGQVKIYAGQSTFEVKVGAGFNTKTTWNWNKPTHNKSYGIFYK